MWRTLWWLLNQQSSIFWWRQCDGFSLTGKNEACHHRRQSQCRDIEIKFCNQWKSHICTVWNQTLSSKMTTLNLQSWVYQRLPPELRTGEDGLACQQSSPQPHWTLVGSACQPRWLTCNKYWSKNVTWPDWSAAGDQQEEEAPGCCGSVWFFHTLMNKLKLWNYQSVFILRSSNPPNTNKSQQ